MQYNKSNSFLTAKNKKKIDMKFAKLYCFDFASYENFNSNLTVL